MNTLYSRSIGKTVIFEPQGWWFDSQLPYSVRVYSFMGQVFSKTMTAVLDHDQAENNKLYPLVIK